jgi:hypothetical protein
MFYTEFCKIYRGPSILTAQGSSTPDTTIKKTRSAGKDTTLPLEKRKEDKLSQIHQQACVHRLLRQGRKGDRVSENNLQINEDEARTLLRKTSQAYARTRGVRPR